MSSAERTAATWYLCLAAEGLPRRHRFELLVLYVGVDCGQIRILWPGVPCVLRAFVWAGRLLKIRICYCLRFEIYFYVGLKVARPWLSNRCSLFRWAVGSWAC